MGCETLLFDHCEIGDLLHTIDRFEKVALRLRHLGVYLIAEGDVAKEIGSPTVVFEVEIRFSFF